MNIGRKEAVAAVHVLAGVQIFMQAVDYGGHCLERSLAKIDCNRKVVKAGQETEEKDKGFSVL